MGALKSIFEWIYNGLTTVISVIASLPGAIVTLVASFAVVVSNLTTWLTSNLSGTSFINSAIDSVNSFKSIDMGANGSGFFDLLSWMGSLDVAFDIFSSLGTLYCGLWSIFIVSTLLAIFSITISTITFRCTCKGINLILPMIKV